MIAHARADAAPATGKARHGMLSSKPKQQPRLLSPFWWDRRPQIKAAGRVLTVISGANRTPITTVT